ncbi:unnamed protein product [Cyclocybe aegerita]|uniref:Protein kinase domain-containing protein n=1 Tax=Cyclocybe aegerita TaxID=1973307 RepID=A0A8S0WFZ1_CYCAE|nr:unnamed protein product [Cyclocybe aegerita]
MQNSSGSPKLWMCSVFHAILGTGGGKVAFAQDTQFRHVAIKLVPEGTDELRILQLLSRQSPQTLRENCLIPVLGFLPIKGFWFVIIPRWGTSISLPRLETLQNVVQIMHSMLKGLTFLHSLNIVHRDLCLRNVLVNHFSSDHSKHYNPWRAELRQAGSLLHAIFDFDLSVIAPPDVKKSEFRLPYDMSWYGSYNQPFDTAQGEFDYDPFAFDVGTMGREFCDWFQHLSADLPLLAPLLDGMTTRNIPRRLTASQALHFLEARLQELSDADLQRPFYETTEHPDYDRYDRWHLVRPYRLRKQMGNL